MDGPRVRAALRLLFFAALFALATWLGRETRPEGSQMALVWPAAGLGVWWLVRCCGRAETVVSTTALVVVTVLANHATEAPPLVALLFGPVNAAHALVGAAVLHRLLPGGLSLRVPGDVGRVLLASLSAATVSGAGSALVAGLVMGEDALGTLLLVMVRNGGSTFVIVCTGVALYGIRRAELLRHPRLTEALYAAVGAGLLFYVVFGTGTLPLLFLGILVPVWFGTRLGVRATAASGLALCVLTVVVTLQGVGPLAAVDDMRLRAVVIQAFIVVLTLVGMSLATLQRAHDELRLDLELSRRELQQAADAAVIGKAVVVRGVDGGWTLTKPNPALVRLLGRDPSSMRWRELLFPNDSLVVRAAIDRIAEGLDASWEGEVRHCLPSGGAIWTQLHVSRMATENGTAAVVVQLLDITERRAAQQELARLAMHDALTGLPNRARLHDGLEELLADATPDARVVVVFLDLDGFKAVNDTYGHDVGDAVLQQVAGALRAALRPEDVVGRLGGDEFVACCPGVAGPEEAEGLVRRLVATVTPSLLVHGRDVGLGVSAGWALSGPGDDGAALLRRSDEAMYTAKRSGSGRVSGDPSLAVPTQR